MKLNKNLPNFIVVGTAKAGTSFLLKYLRQHPDLLIPNSNELYFHSKLKNFAKAIYKIGCYRQGVALNRWYVNALKPL